MGCTTLRLCENQHPCPRESIRTPHRAGRLQFCQSPHAAEPLGTARACGRRGCVPAQAVMEVLAGCAACSAAALEVPSASWEHEPPTRGWSRLFSGFSFQRCHLHIFYYELIPNLLSEKDQTSPYVFVGCSLCLLLSCYPGFEVRLKGKRGSRVWGAHLGEAIAGWKHKTPETPAPRGTVTPCPTRDPPACSRRLCCCRGNQRPWPRLFALMFYFF